MKTIKPQKLGLLTRTFEEGGASYLVVTALALFPFDEPSRLLLETSLWKLAAKELGETPLDLLMPKQRGELLVTGKGYPRGGPRGACSVRVTLGAIDKTLWVVGPRRWKMGAPTEPEPFTGMPITWENAFGGPGFAENPVGKGIASVKGEKGDYQPLPNIEDPKHLLHAPSDRPTAVGFGAYDLTWPQRSSKLGTYDSAWLEERFPGFAADFDLAYFNSAPLDQRIEGYFPEDAAFTVENMHPDKPRIESRLPGLRARVFINQKTDDGEALREIKMRIDTVHLFPHEERGLLLFRGMVKVAEADAADVLQIIGGVEEVSDPRPASHYETVLAQRLDRKKAYLYLLRDQDLMPPRFTGMKGYPGDSSDVNEMLTTEKLLEKNIRQRMVRELEKTREELRAQGLDPDEHAPAELPPIQGPVGIENLGDLTMSLEADFEAKMADLKVQLARADEDARAACAKHGIDYDQRVRDQKKAGGGPPTFSAKEELERLHDQLTLAKNAGASIPHVEAQLADPEIEQKLLRLEQMLFEAYRSFGHYYDPASPREREASARARASVIAAFAAGESLAGRDLTGVDLSNLDLHGAQLQTTFLESSDLSGCDLRGADLTGAMLARANLTGADLSDATLRGANLGSARLNSAKGPGADLSFAVLTKADLSGADFARARLVGADLGEALFAETSFAGANATAVTFLKSDLTGLRLTDADLTKCNFLMASVAGVDFSGATVVSAVFLEVRGDGAVFRDANLTNVRIVKGSSFEGADFSGATLDRANLRGTSLSFSNFTGASMIGADLSECDLRGAELQRIVATGSMFMKADLTGAVLASANLMMAILQRAKIAGASFASANLFRADLLGVEVDHATTMKGADMRQMRYVAPKRDHVAG